MLDELIKSLNSNPNYLFFTVTSKCNAFCDFCWNWENVSDAGKFAKIATKSKRDELSLEEIVKFTKSLPDMFVVNLFGGEPFLREDLVEIVEAFIQNSNAKYISFATNGFATDKVVSDITRLVKRNPKTFFGIFFSLDGPPEHHNYLRKVKNGYEKLMDTVGQINMLKDDHKNFSTSCNINFNNYTQNYIEDFVSDLVKTDIFEAIDVDFIRGNPYDPSFLEADVEKFKRVQKIIQYYNLHSSQPFSPVRKAVLKMSSETLIKNKASDKRVYKCFCGSKFYLLDDIGNIFPCETLIDQPMGNIRDFSYDIRKIMRSPTALKIQQDIRDKKCNCNWNCAINTSIIFDAKNYPKLSYYAMKNILYRDKKE